MTEKDEMVKQEEPCRRVRGGVREYLASELRGSEPGDEKEKEQENRARALPDSPERFRTEDVPPGREERKGGDCNDPSSPGTVEDKRSECSRNAHSREEGEEFCEVEDEAEQECPLNPPGFGKDPGQYIQDKVIYREKENTYYELERCMKLRIFYFLREFRRQPVGEKVEDASIKKNRQQCKHSHTGQEQDYQ